MDNKQQVLSDLSFAKDQALKQAVNHFPAQFYKFGEMVLISPICAAIVQKIVGFSQKEYEKYYATIKKINKVAGDLYEALLEYITDNDQQDFFDDELQSFPLNKSSHSVLAFLQIGKIRTIIAILDNDFEKHSIFLKKITKKMILLGQLAIDLEQQIRYIRRMALIREWGSLQRIYRICQTYNPDWYEFAQKAFVNDGRTLEALILRVQYEGLQRCIDLGDKSANYDQCFDIDADKLAIEDIFSFIEKEISKDSSKNQVTSNNRPKLKFFKNKSGIQVSYGKEQVFFGLKSDEKKINKRREVATLFCVKMEYSGRDFFNAITDSVKETHKRLDPLDLQEVKSTVADFNKELKRKLGITTVLRIKGIDLKNGIIKVFLNPMYL